MKICEITDIIHDEDEHESTVETYLFLNQNEALEKFKELCEDRIDHILIPHSIHLHSEKAPDLCMQQKRIFVFNLIDQNIMFLADFDLLLIRNTLGTIMQ